MKGLIRITLEDELEYAAVERVVAGLVLGHLSQNLGELGLVLGDNPPGLAM